MRPELRMIGISPMLKGAGIMEQMLFRTIKPEDLADEDIKEVLYAWGTRNFIPSKVLEEGNVDHVSPNIAKEEVESGMYTQQQYDRAYVQSIYAYLHTIWA